MQDYIEKDGVSCRFNIKKGFEKFVQIMTKNNNDKVTKISHNQIPF